MSESDSDRRRYPRVEVDLPGTIHAGDKQLICVVKDLSSTGAGLLLDREIVVTGAVQLELHSGDLIPAQISWRAGPRCGLRFDNPVVFSVEPPEAPPPAADMLEPSWRGRLGRKLTGLLARGAGR